MPLSLNIQSAAAFTTPDGGTESVGPISIVGTIVPQRTFLALQSGNNTFAVPTGAVGCIITPPSTGGVVLKVKTVSGDTGMDIPEGSSSLVLFDSLNLPSDLYINAASTMSGNTSVLFF